MNLDRVGKWVGPREAKQEILDGVKRYKKAAKKPMARRIVKKEEPVVEAKKTAPKKAEGKEEPTLEEVDAKLRSIIDNPDINF